MNRLKQINILAILILPIVFSSCITTENTGSIEIEVLKPASISFMGENNTAAIFNRDIYNTEESPYYYTNNLRTYVDSTYNNMKYISRCTKSLEDYLEKEGEFERIDNYTDSLIKVNNKTLDYKELLKQYNADLIIFLDMYLTSDSWLTNWDDVKYAKLVSLLSWTVTSSSDTSIYVFNYSDTLYYNQIDNPEIFSAKNKRICLLENAANYLGESFGAKLIPYWLEVERMYYRSNNPDMLLAEKYALAGDWLKAAEIWKTETENKNINIAAKASFNMAIACEMEEKLDLAIDWLLKSYKTYEVNEFHKKNCQKYINILVNRQREIKRLTYQKTRLN